MEDCHDYNCAICIDVIDEKTITLNKCKHTFHKYCIQQWYYKSNTCPICRRIIKDMFKVKLKVKTNSFFYSNILLCAELKENKIEFRKIIKEKNKIIINNLTFYQDNIALKNNNTDLENNVNTDTNTINLQEINYITDFKEDERLGEVYLTILYSEISKVSILRKEAVFDNLYINKNDNMAYRNINNQKNIKFKFKEKQEGLNFLDVLKNRHRFYRLYND